MEKVELVFASDHAGYDLKRVLIERASSAGYSCYDVGCHTTDSCDYPDYAHQACVQLKYGTFVVLVCGTGQGMCMAANKHPGARAGIAWKPEIAVAMREHNDANVLCLGARHISTEDAWEILQAFSSTMPSKLPRHQRRVDKIRL